MPTLAVRPSKQLILWYGLLYSLSLIIIIIYSQDWPGLISCIVIISLLCAAMLSLYSLCALKAITNLPSEKMDLHFRNSVKHYNHITVRHQGPKLIVLHCKNTEEQRYVLCLADAFAAEDFALLQRLLKQQQWKKS